MSCPRDASSWPPWAAPALVTAAVAGAWGTSVLVDFSTYKSPQIAPRKGAFAIWVAIFPGLVLGSAWTHGAVVPPAAWIALAASLACSAAWAVAARQRAFRVAVALLLGAAAAAWAHAVLAPVWPTPCAPRFLAIEVAGGLYAGWLSLASALGLAIAWPNIFDRPETVVSAAALVAGAAGATGRPWPLAALVWASAFSYREWGGLGTTASVLGLAVCGVALAMARRGIVPT